jgi:hypothetical protein
MRNAMIAALLLSTAACATSAELQPAPRPMEQGGYDLAASRAKIARIPMNPNVSFLNAEERKVVNLLIQAADLMSPIYLRQRSVRNPAVRAEIAATGNAALLDMFDLHYGPWDTLAENHPFYGDRPMPPGAGFYPEDLTKERFEAYLAANPGPERRADQRLYGGEAAGDRLVAVPYSVEYRQWLEPAAKLLEQAARTTSNPSLSKFLNLRARPSGPTTITSPSLPGWT